MIIFLYKNKRDVFSSSWELANYVSGVTTIRKEKSCTLGVHPLLKVPGRDTPPGS